MSEDGSTKRSFSERAAVPILAMFVFHLRGSCVNARIVVNLGAHDLGSVGVDAEILHKVSTTNVTSDELDNTDVVPEFVTDERISQIKTVSTDLHRQILDQHQTGQPSRRKSSTL